MSDPILLHVRHLRTARFCMSGARDWFAARGWNWADFVASGRDIADFTATGCPLAAKAVEAAIEESKNG